MAFLLPKTGVAPLPNPLPPQPVLRSILTEPSTPEGEAPRQLTKAQERTASAILAEKEKQGADPVKRDDPLSDALIYGRQGLKGLEDVPGKSGLKVPTVEAYENQVMGQPIAAQLDWLAKVARPRGI